MIPELAKAELLDAQDPLRHLMQADEDDNDEGSHTSAHNLSVLPRQSHSIKDDILSLEFDGKVSISLYMDASPGCGGVTWPAGQVYLYVRPIFYNTHPSKILSNYIVKKGSEFLERKTIVELGSGTGLVGLVAGKLGAKVWITDQAWVITVTSSLSQ